MMQHQQVAPAGFAASIRGIRLAVEVDHHGRRIPAVYKPGVLFEAWEAISQVRPGDITDDQAAGWLARAIVNISVPAATLRGDPQLAISALTAAIAHFRTWAPGALARFQGRTAGPTSNGGSQRRGRI